MNIRNSICLQMGWIWVRYNFKNNIAFSIIFLKYIFFFLVSLRIFLRFPFDLLLIVVNYVVIYKMLFKCTPTCNYKAFSCLFLFHHNNLNIWFRVFCNVLYKYKPFSWMYNVQWNVYLMGILKYIKLLKISHIL